MRQRALCVDCRPPVSQEGTAISKPSIARSTALMSSLTATSRVTGFIRIWATAYALGATGLMSAYSIANNIPNMIFELVAGGIIAALFIPSFMEVREHHGEEGAWRFASHIFNLSVLALGVIAVIGTIWPAPFIWTQTFRIPGGASSEVVQTAEVFFRFFAVQVVLYGAGSVMSGLLNSQRKYFWPAIAPVFNNVFAIATMLAFAALKDNLPLATVVLASGTTFAVVMMFAVQLPALLKSGGSYTFGIGLDDPAVRRMLRLAVPTVIYVLTNLVAVSFRNASAMAVSEKGVSVLAYAWVFYQLPYGILAVALATAVFTELSEAAGKRDWADFKATFGRGLRITGVLMLPTSALLVALATPLVSLYRVGAFQASDVPLVASALRCWAVGLVFYAGTMYVLRAFYSLKDTRTPMYVNLATTGVQVGLYLVLSTGIGSWAGLGINGMPVADVIFFALTFTVLTFVLRRRIGGFDASGVIRTYALMAVASLVGAAAAWSVSLALEPLVSGFGGSLMQVVVGGTVGLVIALGFGRIAGVAEVSMATALLGRVLGRVNPFKKERT